MVFVIVGFGDGDVHGASGVVALNGVLTLGHAVTVAVLLRRALVLGGTVTTSICMVLDRHA